MSNRPRPNEHSDAAKPDTPDKYRNDKARWKEPVPPDATPEGSPTRNATIPTRRTPWRTERHGAASRDAPAIASPSIATPMRLPDDDRRTGVNSMRARAVQRERIGHRVLGPFPNQL